MGGKSSSKSSSTTSTTTTNYDKRVAVETGIGLSSDNSTVYVEALDAGIVHAALDTVKAADVTAGEGFAQLLSLADKFMTGAGEVIQTTQDTTLKQIDGLNAAAADSRGQIDQKTIMIIAVAGVAAYAYSRKGKA